MIEKKSKLLKREITYSGDGISVRALEESIQAERTRMDSQVQELNALRTRNSELQDALNEEMKRLREISDRMKKSREGSGWRSFLSWLPWIEDEAVTRRSIEELLRRQYEVSSMRLKEAAEFADRLEAAKTDLYDEIERLNAKIISSAKNEERAADYVMDLKNLKTELEGELAVAEPSSAEERQLQSKLDRTRRLLAEHTTKLKLYSTAEERINKLKRNTRQLAETIAHLQGDITRYVTAASEKMDLISGQIQAIGAAADASMVMLELQESLTAMTDSINHTTRFVAETQTYFRENVDGMIDELELYDEETERVMEENLIHNEVVDDVIVEDALSSALAKKIEDIARERGVADDGPDGSGAPEASHEPEEKVILETSTEDAEVQQEEVVEQDS